MKNFNPLVSIVIPVYNGSNYLREAINSALNQTYKNIEIIVVNDGSSDGGLTEQVAKSFGDKIRYFSQENGGCGSALNYGIDLMHGEYFSWLSHDDVYTPNKVAFQIKLLATLVNKNTIIYGDFYLVNERLGLLEDRLIHKLMDSRGFNNSLMPVLSGLIHGCTLLIPRKLFRDIGKFDISKRTTQDYALWFDFFRKASTCYLPYEILVKSRNHPDQDTQRLNKLHLSECNELWSGFLEQITLAEKISLFGSEYGFMVGIAKRLTETPYDLVCKLAHDQVSSEFNKHKISVIIFSNEDLESLDLSIESLKQQTLVNIEVILIHRCSISEIDLERYRSLLSGINIKTYKILENKSSYSFLHVASDYIDGSYLAFLNAGDKFLDVKLEKQLKFMLLNRARISIALPSWQFRDPDFPKALNFPRSIFWITKYLSSVMMDASLLKQIEHCDQNLSPWASLLVFNEALIYKETFTEFSQFRSSGLANLSLLLQDRLSLIQSLSYPQYFYACNFLPRENVLHKANFINEYFQWENHAISDLEDVITEFWYPGEGLDESRFSFKKELAYIKRILIKRMKLALQKIREILVDIRGLSYSDYEGMVVRLIKPLIPTAVWRNATKMYRSARNKVLK